MCNIIIHLTLADDGPHNVVTKKNHSPPHISNGLPLKHNFLVGKKTKLKYVFGTADL